MKTLKISLVLIITLALIFTLTACGSKEEPQDITPQAPQTQTATPDNTNNNTNVGAPAATINNADPYPFGQDVPADFAYGKKFNRDKIKSNEKPNFVMGFFDKAEAAGDGTYNVVGWAYPESKKIEYIVIVDENGIMRGAAKIGFERPGLPEAIGKKDALKSGWIGKIKIEGGSQKLNSYAKLANEPFYVPLSNVVSAGK